MKHAVAIAGLCLALSGCVTKQNPAKTEISFPGGKVEYHCPPGQAKKGNC